MPVKPFFIKSFDFWKNKECDYMTFFHLYQYFFNHLELYQLIITFM